MYNEFGIVINRREELCEYLKKSHCCFKKNQTFVTSKK
jgi:hypothetical protein